ncbi:MAG TPA: helix-turn-helix domain-containing protein [Candidatus Merdenecus merdavium]|nr:helix-turn-helix domain-containing protein [Candidatus Merdenecus merdavium]
MNFDKLSLLAKEGDADAVLEILEMYKPLLIKNAIVNGRFDEDLYQELVSTLLQCIQRFCMSE